MKSKRISVQENRRDAIIPKAAVSGPTGRLQRRADQSGIIERLSRLQNLADSAHHTKSTQSVPLQRVRERIAAPDPKAITLADLEALERSVQDQLQELAANAKETEYSTRLEIIKPDRILTWQQNAAGALQKAQELAPGGTAFKLDQINRRSTPIEAALFKLAVSLMNIRGALNESLDAFSAYEEGQLALDLARERSNDKTPAKKEAAKTPTGKKPEQKWKGYYDKLMEVAQVGTFIQYVPADSKTVKAKSLKEAVFHEGKAFWVSSEKHYQIADQGGKVKMTYVLSKEGIAILIANLICGSGDFAEDNEEEYVGETHHPDFTIWKPNEMGAFGIGANVLARLDAHCKIYPPGR